MKNTLLWILHRVTAALLFAGLAVHFVVMHFAGSAITYQSVQQRLHSRTWIAFNAVFLLSAVFHGFNGLSSIAAEYIRAPWGKRVANALILISAAVLTAAGVYILSLG